VEILEWWSLIFLLPAAAAVLYMLMLAFGAMSFEGLDVDFDAPDDADGIDLLGLLGLGRVPLSLLLVFLGLLWGIVGWLAVSLFRGIWPEPGVFIWPSLAVALVGAIGLTAVAARLLGPLMPRTESFGAGARELVGRLAETRYTVSETAGTVQVYDQYGTLHEVPARVLPGEAAIAAGTQVVLWRFDDATGSYLVTQDDALVATGKRLPAA
jgi:hypothetical protein